jgi:calcineurin-like phosphoesterase family protein
MSNEIFFSADLHFEHSNILKHCNRRWLREGDIVNGRWVCSQVAQDRTNEMNEALVDLWNSVVSKRDRVYILGDFAFKNHGKWINALNGKKVLILGNHDDMSAILRSQFSECHEFGVERNLQKQRVTMCHYPLRSWNRCMYGSWHLHGHCHGRMTLSRPGPSNIDGGLILDVGVDVWDYKPVSFEEIRKQMDIKKEAISSKK